MTKFSKIFVLAGLSLAIGIACVPPADDDDDDATSHDVNAGTYDATNHAVAKDECLYAGLPSPPQFDIVTPNGLTGDILVGPTGTPQGQMVSLERNTNNYTGFEQSTFDHNPTNNCIEEDTTNWDGVITAVDTITITFTTFFDHVDPQTGIDSECLAGNPGVTIWPCETVESFDLTLP